MIINESSLVYIFTIKPTQTDDRYLYAMTNVKLNHVQYHSTHHGEFRGELNGVEHG